MRLKNKVKELEDDIISLKARLVQVEYSNSISKTKNEIHISNITQELIRQLSKASDKNYKLSKRIEDLEEIIQMICQKDGIVILRK